MVRNLKNIILVAFKPKQVFEAVKEKQGSIWIAALLLLIGISFARSVISIPATQKQAKEIFAKSVVVSGEVKVDSKNGGDISQEQPPPEVQKQIEESANNPLIFVGGSVFEVIGTVIGFFLSVVLLLFVLRLLGSSADFNVTATIMALSLVPYIFRNVIWGTYAFAFEKLPNMQGLASVFFDTKNPANLIGPDAPPVILTTALSRIDLFVAWSLILMFFGFLIFAGLSKKKSIGVVAGYWIITFLLILIPAIATTMLMPAGIM